MDILIIGNGGREHALAWRCKQDEPSCTVHVAPGNAGMADVATLHPVEMDNVAGLLGVALQVQPDLVLIGPEAALASGVSDVLRAHGLWVFGPEVDAARLETSKAFAKTVLAECGIPTARHWMASSAADVAAAVAAGARVVKADGLAGGKGVTVCGDAAAAQAAGQDALATFGAPVLMEELVVGQEVSVIALCDGASVLMLPSVQDHKRLLDGDEGPNTGGMGAISPGTHHSRLGISEDALLHRVKQDIILPVLQAMRERGTPFVGALFAGLMVDPGTGMVSVLEFNARLGDPETQVLMRRIKGNLPKALLACAKGDASRVTLGVLDEPAVCVVMAAEGYPGVTRKGDVVAGLEAAAQQEGVQLFFNGVARKDDLVTHGGRILAVTAVGQNVAQALERSYSAVARIGWPGVHYRRDIGRVGA